MYTVKLSKKDLTKVKLRAEMEWVKWVCTTVLVHSDQGVIWFEGNFKLLSCIL